MAYLVLARKYRPTTLACLVGQEHIVRTLHNAIALQRVHHAFLFTGARGVGKTTTARIMGRALNCVQGPTIEPCGECTPCTDILAGCSPDVLEIDGASNTGVDNVRELRENVRYLPSQGRYKIYIIDEVHMLSQAAFNALLKTLEEPPDHVKFIFATTEPHKIPLTILSRCQRFDFRRVGHAPLMAHLRHVLEQEKVALSDLALNAIVREAQGSVRDALSLLDQVLSYAGDNIKDDSVLAALGAVDGESIFALVDAIFARDAKALLYKVNELDCRGHDLAQVASLFAAHLRDLAVLKHLKELDNELMQRSQGEVAALQSQAALRSHSDLQRLFCEALTTAEDVGRSSMPRVSLEMGMLRLMEVACTVDLQTLLQRLDALAAGAAGNLAPSSPSQGAVQPPRTAVQPQAPAVVVQNPAVPPLEPHAQADASAHRAWRDFVQTVRAARPAVASVLEHGNMLSFNAQGVEVAYSRGSFYWDQAREAETLEFLGKILAQQFSQPVALKIVSLQATMNAGLSLAQVSEQERQQHEKGVRLTARENPTVQSALNILGGEIKEVHALAPAPPTET